jgi:hypothetical protein
MWKVENPQLKEEYERKAAREKERVQREREQYEAMYGKPESKKKRKRNFRKNYELLKKYVNSRDTFNINEDSDSDSGTASVRYNAHDSSSEAHRSKGSRTNKTFI